MRLINCANAAGSPFGDRALDDFWGHAEASEGGSARDAFEPVTSDESANVAPVASASPFGSLGSIADDLATAVSVSLGLGAAHGSAGVAGGSGRAQAVSGGGAASGGSAAPAAVGSVGIGQSSGNAGRPAAQNSLGSSPLWQTVATGMQSLANNPIGQPRLAPVDMASPGAEPDQTPDRIGPTEPTDVDGQAPPNGPAGPNFVSHDRRRTRIGADVPPSFNSRHHAPVFVPFGGPPLGHGGGSGFGRSGPEGMSPVAVDDAVLTDEDVAINIYWLSYNDYDTEAIPVTVTAVAQPLHGTTSLGKDGTVTYTPVPNWSGSDSFSYTISNELEETDTGDVTVTVQPVYYPPTANNVRK